MLRDDVVYPENGPICAVRLFGAQSLGLPRETTLFLPKRQTLGIEYLCLFSPFLRLIATTLIPKRPNLCRNGKEQQNQLKESWTFRAFYLVSFVPFLARLCRFGTVWDVPCRLMAVCAVSCGFQPVCSVLCRFRTVWDVSCRFMPVFAVSCRFMPVCAVLRPF